MTEHLLTVEERISAIIEYAIKAEKAFGVESEYFNANAWAIAWHIHHLAEGIDLSLIYKGLSDEMKSEILRSTPKEEK